MADNSGAPPASGARPRLSKPRSGVQRKSKAERDEFAKQEAERAAIRAAAESKPDTSQDTSTTRGAGSRSARERSQRGGGTGGTAVATGVFGAGSGSKPVSRSRLIDRGTSELLSGQQAHLTADEQLMTARGSGDRTGNRSGTGNTKSRLKDNEDEVYVDEYADRQSYYDIEYIDQSSEDTDNDRSFAKGKIRAADSRSPRPFVGYRPIRMPRIAAKEELSREEQLGEQESDITRRRRLKAARARWPTYGDEDLDRSDVDEIHSDHQDMHGVEAGIKEQPPSSPELSKRNTAKKVTTRTKDDRLVTETVEERAERHRLHRDVERMKRTFSVPIPEHVRSHTDIRLPDNEEVPGPKLFLFQFPPLVPFLVDAASTNPESVKEEEDAFIKQESDAPNQTAVGGAPLPGDKSTATARSSLKHEGLFTAVDQAKFPAGRVGRLLVHKSGKVTLDWGGTDMEVRYGTEVSFLQDAILVETPTANEDSEKRGAVYALGQIQNKMVVIPDWQRLYD